MSPIPPNCSTGACPDDPCEFILVDGDGDALDINPDGSLNVGITVAAIEWEIKNDTGAPLPVVGNKQEDSPAADADYGVPVLGVRNDAAVTRTSTDGDYGMVALDAAGRVGIADLGGSITVDGPLTDAQLRATPVPVSGTVSTGGLTDAELRATPVPVSGTVTVTDGSGPLTVDGTVTVANPGLTDAQLRATPVPVSGTVTITDGAGPVTVDGTVAITSADLATLVTLNQPVATFAHGQASSSVVAAQLPANADLRGLILKAQTENASDIYIGNSAGVTTLTGYQLSPGETLSLPVDNSNDIWHIAASGTPRLDWIVT